MGKRLVFGMLLLSSCGRGSGHGDLDTGDLVEFLGITSWQVPLDKDAVPRLRAASVRFIKGVGKADEILTLDFDQTTRSVLHDAGDRGTLQILLQDGFQEGRLRLMIRCETDEGTVAVWKVFPSPFSSELRRSQCNVGENPFQLDRPHLMLVASSGPTTDNFDDPANEEKLFFVLERLR